MKKPLRVGNRLLFVVSGDIATRSWLRQFDEDGELLVTHGGKSPLDTGGTIDVEMCEEFPKKIYHMQIKHPPITGNPYLRLQRNPSTRFNQSRRNWRIPFSDTSSIRSFSEPHLKSTFFL